MNNKFIFYLVTLLIKVNNSNVLFYRHIHSKNPKLEAYSDLKIVKVVDIRQIAICDVKNESLIEQLSKFSTEINEEVYSYEINDLDNLD